MENPTRKDPYQIITKESIGNILQGISESYQGDEVHPERDNDLLSGKIADLLGLSFSEMADFMQRVRLKALGQILGLDGSAVEVGKYPKITVDYFEHETGKEKIKVKIPDINDENIIQFAGWYPLEYLIYNLYFLVEIYTRIKLGKLTIPNSLEIDKEIAEELLTHEIWVCSNAYKICKAYKQLLDNNNPDQLENLMIGYFNAIKNAKPEEYEFCLPCGYAEHADYLVLVYYKEKQRLYMRVDNASNEIPIEFLPLDLSDTKVFDKVVQRLKEVCEVTKKGQNEANEIIYKLDETFKEHKSKQLPLKKQSAPNCVVEGYWHGMWHRLSESEQYNDSKFFHWILNLEKQNVTDTHNISSQAQIQHNLRDEILIKKTHENDVYIKDFNFTKSGLCIEIDIANISAIDENMIRILCLLINFDGKPVEIKRVLTDTQITLFNELVGQLLEKKQIKKTLITFECAKILITNSKIALGSTKDGITEDNKSIRSVSEPVEKFIIRYKVLDRIERNIQSKSIYALTGISGSGKTQLARYAVKRLISNDNTSNNEDLRKRFYQENRNLGQKFFLKEFFLVNETTLKESLIKFIQELNFYLNDEEDLFKLEPKQLFSVIVRSYNIIINKPFIFIFDNIDDLKVAEHLKFFINNYRDFIKRNGIILITSQIEEVIKTDAEVESISINKGMALEECFELIERKEKYQKLISLLENQEKVQHYFASDISCIKSSIASFNILTSDSEVAELCSILQLIDEFSGLPFGLRVSSLYIKTIGNDIASYLYKFENEKTKFQTNPVYNDCLKRLASDDPYIVEKGVVSQILAIKMLFDRFPKKVLNDYKISYFEILKLISLLDNKNIPDIFLEFILDFHKKEKQNKYLDDYVVRFIIELKQLSLLEDLTLKQIPSLEENEKNNNVKMISLHQITRTAIQVEIGEANIIDYMRKAWSILNDFLNKEDLRFSKPLLSKIMSEHFFRLLTTMRFLNKEIEYDVNLVNSCLDVIYEVSTAYEYYIKYQNILKKKDINENYKIWKKLDILIFAKVVINLINSFSEKNDNRYLSIIENERKYFVFLRDQFAHNTELINSLTLDEKCFLVENIIRFSLHEEKQVLVENKQKNKSNNDQLGNNSTNLMVHATIKSNHSFSPLLRRPASNTTASNTIVKKFRRNLQKLKDSVIKSLTSTNLTKSYLNFILILPDYYYLMELGYKEFLPKNRYFNNNDYELTIDLKKLFISIDESFPNFSIPHDSLEKFNNMIDTFNNVVILTEFYSLSAMISLNNRDFEKVNQCLDKISSFFKKYNFIDWNLEAFSLLKTFCYIAQAPEDKDKIEKISFLTNRLKTIILKYKNNCSPIINLLLGYCYHGISNYTDAISEYAKHVNNFSHLHTYFIDNLNLNLSNEMNRVLFFMPKPNKLLCSTSFFSIDTIHENLIKCYEQIRDYKNAYKTLAKLIDMRIRISEYPKSDNAEMDARKLGSLAKQISETNELTPYEQSLHHGNVEIEFLLAIFQEIKDADKLHEGSEIAIKLASKFYCIFEKGYRKEISLIKSADIYYEANIHDKALNGYYELSKLKFKKLPIDKYIKSLKETFKLYQENGEFDRLKNAIGMVILDEKLENNHKESMAEIIFDIGLALFQNEQKEVASFFFEKAIRLYNHPKAIYYFGLFYYENKKYYKSASIILESIIKDDKNVLDPTKEILANSLAYPNLTFDDNEKLFEMFFRLKIKIKLPAGLCLNLGRLHLKEESIDSAISMFEDTCKTLFKAKNETEIKLLLEELNKNVKPNKDNIYSECCKNILISYKRKLIQIIDIIKEKKDKQENIDNELSDAREIMKIANIVAPKNDMELNHLKDTIIILEGNLDNMIANLKSKEKNSFLSYYSSSLNEDEKNELSLLLFRKANSLIQQHSISFDAFFTSEKSEMIKTIITYLKEALDYNKLYHEASYLLATIYYLGQQYTESKEQISKISNDNKYKHYHLILGNCLYEETKIYRKKYGTNERYDELCQISLDTLKLALFTSSVTSVPPYAKFLDMIAQVHWLKLTLRKIKSLINSSNVSMDSQIFLKYLEFTKLPEKTIQMHTYDKTFIYFLYLKAKFYYKNATFHLSLIRDNHNEVLNDFDNSYRLLSQLVNINFESVQQTVSNKGKSLRDIKPRKGLKDEEKLRAVLAGHIPQALILGKAFNTGDCFFDALAQCLNSINQTDVNTDKYLRNECHVFYLKNKDLVDEWNASEFGGIDNQKDKYFMVQYTADEYGEHFHGRPPIWGRPIVEGRILCRQLDLEAICVIEILENPETKQPVVSFHLVKKDTYKSISEEEAQVRLTNLKIPAIVVEQNSLHFVPLLSSSQANQKSSVTKFVEHSLNFQQNSISKDNDLTANPILEKARMKSVNILQVFFRYKIINQDEFNALSKNAIASNTCSIEFEFIPEIIQNNFENFELEKIRKLIYKKINDYLEHSVKNASYKFGLAKHGSAGREKANTLLKKLDKIIKTEVFFVEIANLFRNNGKGSEHSLTTLIQQAIYTIRDNPHDYYMSHISNQNIISTIRKSLELN